jgi:hypothetical protein
VSSSGFRTVHLVLQAVQMDCTACAVWKVVLAHSKVQCTVIQGCVRLAVQHCTGHRRYTYTPFLQMVCPALPNWIGHSGNGKGCLPLVACCVGCTRCGTSEPKMEAVQLAACSTTDGRQYNRLRQYDWLWAAQLAAGTTVPLVITSRAVQCTRVYVCFQM